MKTIQIFLSVAAGKKLIAKGLAAREDVQDALRHHSILIIKGTTNAYVAEELLNSICYEGFSKKGFFRGLIKPAEAKVSVPIVEHDLLIREGNVITDQSIYDVVNDLGEHDFAFKGANAVNLDTGRAGILVGNPTGGTIVPLVGANVGKKVKLIHPVGVEKRVEADIADLAEICNSNSTQGLRMFPSSGKAYTELDAFSDLFPVEAAILAGGGVGGYEGGCYFLVHGEEKDLAECRKLCNEISKEPMFEL